MIACYPATRSSADLLQSISPVVRRLVTGKRVLQRTTRKLGSPGGVSRWYEVVCRILAPPGQAPTEHLFILRDIADRRQALDALATAHKKLNLLSSVTRHDMMNKVTGLTVYLDLMKSTNDPAMNAVYLQRIDEITRH